MTRAQAWIRADRWAISHWVVAVVWLAALLLVQWKLATGFAAAADPDPSRNDQGAYLRLTTDNLRYWWPTATDGIRNPLFPFLLKPWHSTELAQFFGRAKLVNIVFGLLGTITLAGFWIRRFPFLAALNLTTLTALVVTLPGSSWVGAEAVFYVGFFFLWLVCAELLTRNPLWLYGVAGLISALTYLTKPSITLLIAIFFGLSLLRAVWAKWRGPAESAWSARRLLLGTAVYVVALGVPILPRAFYSAQHFGNPFQNSAQACMWFDDWNSAYEQLGYLNPKMIDRVPVEKRPSPLNYISRHTTLEIFDRFAKGADRQFHNFFLPEGTWDKGRKMQAPELRLTVRARGIYPLLLAALVIAFALANRTIPDPPGACERCRAWAILALSAFVVHFLAFAFYTPIAGGARFIMSMYLPILAALGFAFETLRSRKDFGWRAVCYTVAQAAFAACMLWHLGWLSTVKRFGEVRGAF